MMYYHFMCSLWFNCHSKKPLGTFGYSEVCWFCLQFIQIGKVVNDVNVLTRIKNYMKPYPKWKLNSLQLKTPLVWRSEVPTKWISARPPTREESWSPQTAGPCVTWDPACQGHQRLTYFGIRVLDSGGAQPVLSGLFQSLIFVAKTSNQLVNLIALRSRVALY